MLSLKPNVLWALLSLKLVLLFALAWNTIFVMDEMVFLGKSLHFSNGLYESIWPGKAVGYSFVYLAAHFSGWDAASTLLSGRIVAALATCISLALVYLAAVALGYERLKAMLVVVIVLSFSTFMERAFRVRAEPIGLVFGLASLLVMVRGTASDYRRILLAGLLCGLAFVTHQKAVYYNLALGCALVGDAWLRQRFLEGLLRGVSLVVGWFAIVIAYSLILGGGDFLLILKNLFGGPSELVLEGADYYPSSMWNFFIKQTLVRNSILYALGFLGLVISIFEVRKMDESRRIAFIFSIVITVLIFRHNQPWPYVFVMAIPFLSLWVLVPFERLPTGSPLMRAAPVVLLAAFGLSIGANINYLKRDNLFQLEVVRLADRLLTDDEDGYLDMVGMLPTHYQKNNRVLDQMAMTKLKAEGASSETLQGYIDRPPKVLIENFRSQQIVEELQPLLQGRYMRIHSNISVPGRMLNATKDTVFDVPDPGLYNLYTVEGRKVDTLMYIDNKLLSPPFHFERRKYSLKPHDADEMFYILPDGLPHDLALPVPEFRDLFYNLYH